MNNATKEVMPRQALAVINVLMTWWIYAAIILSLIGVVLWLVELVSGIVFPDWVTISWLTFDILITILLFLECFRHVVREEAREKEKPGKQDTEKQGKMGMWDEAAIVAIAGSIVMLIVASIWGSFTRGAGGGVYSLWTLVCTVGILALSMYSHSQEQLKESEW